jgi:hypothetical protein
MKNKEPVARVRIYQKEYGVLRRLALRKSLVAKTPVTIAEIIRQLIKGV